MSQRPFRFLHAADLHLEQPASGLAEVPPHLADLLIDCPLLAAARVFDAAIDQRVDLVVLIGGVVDPTCCSPRELLFLVEQFERLAERQIAVYWAGGARDSLDHWPGFIKWPANVRFFSRSRVERHQHEVGRVPVCDVIGRSHDEKGAPHVYEFAPSRASEFTVAVANADWNGGALGEIGVKYWALGGSRQRFTPATANCTAHYPGSPQGRRPSETGPHGCTLVHVDEEQRVQMTPIACDVVRWQSPRLSLSSSADALELEQLLRTRVNEMRTDSSGAALIVTWKIDCQGKLLSALRHGSLANELATKLRADFGQMKQSLWTATIEAELPEVLPAVWYDEQCLRGDFLRAAREPHVAQHEVFADYADQLSTITVGQDDAESQRRLLNEVAWLGSELLSPEETV
jgi:DNA repair exonuclease SbcCD nuclease subunit